VKLETPTNVSTAECQLLLSTDYVIPTVPTDHTRTEYRARSAPTAVVHAAAEKTTVLVAKMATTSSEIPVSRTVLLVGHTHLTANVLNVWMTIVSFAIRQLQRNASFVTIEHTSCTENVKLLATMGTT
jgi:hypothetical protein